MGIKVTAVGLICLSLGMLGVVVAIPAFITGILLLIGAILILAGV